MKATTLSKVKKGEYFTFKPVECPTSNLVYVRSDYVRSTKKVEYYPSTMFVTASTASVTDLCM